MGAYWTTQNGIKMNVKDMTTQHILNCIRCIEEGRIQFLINLGWSEDNDFQVIEENDLERDRWLNIFNEEIERRK